MEVVLVKDVESLGRVGDVVKVKDGYARNCLFPQKLAHVATPANLKRIEQQAKQRKAEYEAEKKVAQDFADALSSISCTVTAEVNDLEKLYGAITEAEIAKAIEVEGHNVDKKQIIIKDPIEELGIFEIGIKLHPDVTAKVRLWVTKK